LWKRFPTAIKALERLFSSSAQRDLGLKAYRAMAMLKINISFKRSVYQGFYSFESLE